MWLVLACASPRPRIGLTGGSEALADAIRAAGGEAVSLDPAVHDLTGLEGLVLGPGADLDPALYGEDPDPTVVLVATDRQEQDLALARAALAADVPVLGICLGAQSLAVAAGATLVQDLPSERGLAVDHRAEHAVAVVPGSPLAAWYGTSARVWSNHHQAVDTLPEGFRLAATAQDATLEAYWLPDRTFAVGLQFHPEYPPTSSAPWSALVAAARP